MDVFVVYIPITPFVDVNIWFALIFRLAYPRDLDAAYRLTFSGGITHSATGVLFGGSNGVSNMADSEWSMAYGSGKITFGMYRSNTTQVTTTLQGFSAIGMETNGQRSIYKNGNRIVNNSDGFIPLPQNLKMYMSARNANGNADFYTSAQYSFAFISNTLTLTEHTAFYNAVQKFQTILNRQIGSAIMPSGQVEQLLETYSGSALAYSTRKIRGGYTGPAIRVRRSSDNTEQDISFTSSGDLDTAALLAFTGTSNGFVSKWYDQSGNARDLVQTTQSLQPQISMNGIVFTERGRPTIASTGASLLNVGSIPLTISQLTSFALFRMNSTRKNMFLGNFGGAHVSPSRSTTGNNRYFGTTTGDIVYAPMANGNNQFVISNNGGLISAWENGTQMVNSAPYVTADGIGNYISLFDRWANSGPLNQGTSISEVIFYNSGMTASKSAIETNAITYFNPSYSMDTDATAFLSATGITNSTISDAINVMVKSLKSEGLWTKMKAIYPFVGGTTTTHKFNLKDPRDLDVAFRLTPYGGITNDAGGVQFNGTNGYFDTNMNAANNLSVNSLHLSFYSLTNNSNIYSGGEIGHVGYNSWTSPPQDYTKQLSLRVRNSQYAGSNAQFVSGNGYSSYSTIDGYGLTIGSITSATASYIRKGYNSQYFADKSSTGATNTGTLPAYNICIGKTQGYGEFSQQKCAFASIGDGLSYDESAKLYGIVQIFQISLGRQV